MYVCVCGKLFHILNHIYYLFFNQQLFLDDTNQHPVSIDFFFFLVDSICISSFQYPRCQTDRNLVPTDLGNVNMPL